MVLCWVVDSFVDGIVLVELPDVDKGPGAGEDQTNNNEDASVHESGSGRVFILGEENYKERACNKEWEVSSEHDNWVVPGKVIIEKLKEVVGNQPDSECKGNNTDTDNTAFNWETSEAGLLLSLFIRASAEAATAC